MVTDLPGMKEGQRFGPCSEVQGPTVRVSRHWTEKGLN